MRSCDINVLVYAFDRDAPRHEEYRAWLMDVLQGPEHFGVPSVVLSGFIRIVTHPGIPRARPELATVLRFAELVRSAPFSVSMDAGPAHWEIFSGLCRKVEAKGNVVPDAYLAALAVEHRCEWNTTDRGFARFPGLRWRHPLDH